MIKDQLVYFGKLLGVLVFAFLVGSFVYGFLSAFRLFRMAVSPDPLELLVVFFVCYLLANWCQISQRAALWLFVLSLILLFFLPYIQVIFFLALFSILKNAMKL